MSQLSDEELCIVKFLDPIKKAIMEKDDAKIHYYIVYLLETFFFHDKMDKIDSDTNFYGSFLCSIANNDSVKYTMGRFSDGFEFKEEGFIGS